jgi:CheY-like chemotaxis protein
LIDTPKKILIVEDDEDIQLYYRILLSDLGAELVPALHGEEALEIIDGEEPVDLILLDIVLPTMDGKEFLSRLRNDRDSKVPVILCSVDDELMERMNIQGSVQGIFTKGSRGSDLKEMVCHLLKI